MAVMGLFEVDVRVAPVPPNGPAGWETVRLLVDTGATFSTIPEAVLQKIGVTVLGTVPVELADKSTVTKDYGWAVIEVEGRHVPGIVLFGRSGDFALLGATTLEQACIAVDPAKRRLFPTAAIQA
ncbi:MAG: retroviral-like aspartic protease family protein [Planctomycetes bacterium]|nr:retroviral-like aspartic protease family protein [Planctomycetota bacterium]